MWADVEALAPQRRPVISLSLGTQPISAGPMSLPLLLLPRGGVGAHSVAADLASNHIFVPIAAPDPACPNGCIAVFSTVNADMNGLSRAH